MATWEILTLVCLALDTTTAHLVDLNNVSVKSLHLCRRTKHTFSLSQLRSTSFFSTGFS